LGGRKRKDEIDDSHRGEEVGSKVWEGGEWGEPVWWKSADKARGKEGVLRGGYLDHQRRLIPPQDSPGLAHLDVGVFH
jgi:hypothetical protein